MSTANSSTVIIAIPGTDETQELNIQAAKAAIARGEIAPNHWAWSPLHNDWKQVSELPELQLDPIITSKPVSVRATPAVKAKSRVVVSSSSSASLKVKEEASFSFFKLFVIGLALAVIGIVGANYFLLDQPLRTSLSQTSFTTTQVHAHLGAFLQPNTLAIHLLPTKEVQADNLADFLVDLAKSTPQQPFNQQTFKTVGLTSAWTSQYMISGADWQSLGQMDKSTEDEKKAYILDHLLYPTGQHLLGTKKEEDPSALAELQNKVWASLFASLIH